MDWATAGAAMSRRILIDGRNVLNGEELAAQGFTYSSFGRGTVAPKGAATCSTACCSSDAT